jgi:SAM-dependent methyltransferase
MSTVELRPNWGRLKRFQPFCADWGNGRGGPIDRFYIDRFVARELRRAKGSFLECGGDRYRQFVTKASISRYEVVDVDIKLPSLTIQNDIQDLRGIKNCDFDVIVCTQVLQYVENPLKAVSELRRVLKRGGRLLVTTPFVEKDYKRLRDRWRFTRYEMLSLLRPFKKCEVSVGGNLFVAACYWMGLGIDDVDPEDLERVDDTFYQVVLAKAIK